MSKELIKIDVESLSIVSRTDLIDIEVAKKYPAIPNAFNTLYTQIQEKASEAKGVIDSFEGAETNEEKLELAPLAKELIKAIKPMLGKNGAVEMKASFKNEPLQITRLIDGGFNAVKNLGAETIDPLERIAKYADIIKAQEVERLHTERTEQITILGGEEFLYKYPNGLGNYTPEQFDEVLEDIHGWIKLANFEKAEAKRQADAEALKAKADAEKQAIRTARGKQLHAVGYYHDGDLAEISEGDFLKLLETAQAEKMQADKKAEADKLEAQRLAKIESDKQADALRLAKAKADELAQAEAKRIADEKAEADRLEAIAKGDDKGKVKLLSDKVRELVDSLEATNLSSKRGQDFKEWATPKVAEINSTVYSFYNKL